MSSWVVPTVAAEIWHVSVQTIFDCIRDGTLRSRVDGEFLFVDIATADDTIIRAITPPQPTPATFSPITSEEMAALNSPEPLASSEASTPESSSEVVCPDVSQWRWVRQNVSKSRRAPVLVSVG
jgi:hypothetical protein